MIIDYCLINKSSNTIQHITHILHFSKMLGFHPLLSIVSHTVGRFHVKHSTHQVGFHNPILGIFNIKEPTFG